MTPYTDHSLLLDRLKWQLQRARTASYDRPRTAEQKQARAAYMRKWAKAHPDYRRKTVHQPLEKAGESEKGVA